MKVEKGRYKKCNAVKTSRERSDYVSGYFHGCTLVFLMEVNVCKRIVEAMDKESINLENNFECKIPSIFFLIKVHIYIS